MRVYADNAATTKLSPAAKEAMLPYFDEIYGNPSTLYTLGQEAAEHLLACRSEIAQLIGAADPREIVLDRKSTRLNSSHYQQSRMPSSA